MNGNTGLQLFFALLFPSLLMVLAMNQLGHIALIPEFYWTAKLVVGFYTFLPVIAVLGLVLLIRNLKEEINLPRLVNLVLVSVACNTSLMILADMNLSALVYGGSHVLYAWLYDKYIPKKEV